MPQRNGPRSSKGRSAQARRVLFGGPSGTNGILSSKGYFGGMKKGGAPPSATGFMRPTSKLAQITPTQKRPDFLFVFKTNLGPKPFGFTS